MMALCSLCPANIFPISACIEMSTDKGGWDDVSQKRGGPFNTVIVAVEETNNGHAAAESERDFSLSFYRRLAAAVRLYVRCYCATATMQMHVQPGTSRGDPGQRPSFHQKSPALEPMAKATDEPGSYLVDVVHVRYHDRHRACRSFGFCCCCC